MSRRPDTARRVAEVVRFDGTQRLAHWLNAALFGVLMATALPLYFSGVAALVGRRALVEQIHLYVGLATPVPLIVLLAGPWGRRLRADIRRINYWTRDEIAWLRTFGRRGGPVLDKFNPGQKLNAIFTGAALVIMVATGAMLKWFRFFPVNFRTGATFVHDVFAFAVFLVVSGHVLFAFTHPGALVSMLTGKVSERWAALNAPGWLAEELAAGETTAGAGATGAPGEAPAVR